MSYVDRYLLAITDARKALPQRQPSASVPEYDWQRLRFILSRRYDRAEFGVTVLDIGEEDPTRYYKYMNERIAELTGRNMESIYTLGYRIIEEVWLPEEVPMLVTAHERFFDHLKQLDPAEWVQHTLVACNSIRRPDGSVIRMITVGRLLPNVHGNGSTALLGYHYLTAPITPPFVVTSFDGLAGTADVMPLMPPASTEVETIGSTTADRDAATLAERYRQFLGNLTLLAPTLTPAEERVCVHIVEGRSTKDISDLLSLSLRTVENHRMSIRRKLGLRDKENLITVLASIHRQSADAP